MNKIIGYEKEKAEIATFRDMLINKEKFCKCGVRIPRGLLLTGKPGVGKTVLAKSVAGNGINLVELRASMCCDEEAIEAVKNVFASAKKKSPSVLLLDELDKIAGMARNFYMEENDKIRKTLLQELDDLDPNDDVLVVATCNEDSLMSEELIRPGRFDRQICISVPDEETRRRILNEYFGTIKAKIDFNIDTLAKNTAGYTGAKLECLANDAGILALAKEDPAITEDDIRIAINKLEFCANEKNPFDDFEEIHRIATHEAGHAFAALYLAPKCIFGASILPQGDANGYIRFVDDDDERITTVRQMENEIAVMLAGHVAERVILGEYLTGSCSDISEAVIKAYYIVTREGAYGYENVVAGFLPHSKIVSDSSKALLDSTVTEKLYELDAKVEQLIYDHPEVFSAICHALEEKRVLSREELYEIKEKADENTAA